MSRGPSYGIMARSRLVEAVFRVLTKMNLRECEMIMTERKNPDGGAHSLRHPAQEFNVPASKGFC